MAIAMKYPFKGQHLTMKELAEKFGVSYARMSFLMKQNGMNAHTVLETRGLGKVTKGKRAEKYLVNSSEGIYLTVREIMNETQLTYAQVAGRIKKNIRGAALLMTKAELDAEKATVKKNKAMLSAKMRDERKAKREAAKLDRKIELGEKAKAKMAKDLARKQELTSKYGTIGPYGNKMSADDFIKELEAERDKVVETQNAVIYSDERDLDTIMNESESDFVDSIASGDVKIANGW